MRTVHKTAAIVAALGIALAVTACGGDTKSAPVPKSTPKATVTTTMPTPTATPTPTVSPLPTPTATRAVAPLSVDKSLRMDLKNMATAQEAWITDHFGPENPQGHGVAVTATKPGGTARIGTFTFHASPGNVIAVKVAKNGFCVSGYNKAATTATSATKSLLFNSEKGGQQAGVGAC